MESNFGPRREVQSRKLSPFKGWAKGENKSEKFSAASVRNETGWIKKKGVVFFVTRHNH